MRHLLIALIAITGLASCSEMKKPELVGIEDFKVGKIRASETSATVFIKFYNPNSFKAKVKHAEGDAWIDSIYLGRFIVDEKIEVPAKSEFTVPVDLKITMANFALQAMMLMNKKEIFIRTDGNIRAGRNGFYRNISLKYEGKHDMQKLLNNK